MKCGVARHMRAVCATLLVVAMVGCGAITESGDAAVDARTETVTTTVIDHELGSLLATLPPDETLPVIAYLADRSSFIPAAYVAKNVAREQVVRARVGHAAMTQEPFQEFLAARGITRTTSLWIVDGIAFEGTGADVYALAGVDGIARIGLDAVFTEAAPLAAGAAPDEWNLYAVGAPDAWGAGFAGDGAVVALMDSGVDAAHQELGPRFRGGTNGWFDPFGEHAAPFDRSGHGTQAAGLVLGGNASGVSVGVAPNARWIGVKIFNDAGTTTMSRIHEAFQWLIDPDGNPATSDAPDVVNASWGLKNYLDTCVPEFREDIVLLKAAGIAVVASAGNEGPSAATSVSPANYPETLSVGALDDTFSVPLFSSRGPSACDGALFPKVAAPGVNVLTTDLTANSVFPAAYAHVSGTSFAAAQVSGAYAVLAAALPGIEVGAIETAMMDAALDVGDLGLDSAAGYGLIDIMGAYRLLTNAVFCIDEDADGYFADAGCATERDCDDFDATVYPFAADTPHDGIDQDCNGYDLTIEVKARYVQRTDALMVEATSGLGRNAFLEVTGRGAMRWNVARARYELALTGAGGDPVAIEVIGVEGAVTVAVEKARGVASAPPSPTALLVTDVRYGAVDLAWTDAADNEAGVIVERALAATGPFAVVGTAMKDEVSFTDRSARSGLTYFYQVRAFNSGGYSAESNIISVTMP